MRCYWNPDVPFNTWVFVKTSIIHNCSWISVVLTRLCVHICTCYIVPLNILFLTPRLSITPCFTKIAVHVFAILSECGCCSSVYIGRIMSTKATCFLHLFHFGPRFIILDVWFTIVIWMVYICIQPTTLLNAAIVFMPLTDISHSWKKCCMFLELCTYLNVA